MYIIQDLKTQLEQQAITSSQLVEQMLDRTADPAGQGSKTYLTTYAEEAKAQAAAVDAARQNGHHLPPFAGIPISIKDLFDVAGETTTAGSKALAHRPPASADAPLIARLRRAGFILLGKVNMTEFAFSGLGINPHFGTPLSVADRDTGRIPGGSSSGGGVSVADGMAVATIGTDTGGSCRIPAAFNGIVGFKPTAKRVPKNGVIPLSTTLDSVGPLANSVSCAAILDDVLAGGAGADVSAHPVKGLRLGVLKTLVLDQMDETVAAVYERTLSYLSELGAVLIDVEIPDILRIQASNPKGSLVAAEAYAWHRSLLESHGDLYDSFVRGRLMGGSQMLAADYIDIVEHRQSLIEAIRPQTEIFDAIVMPSVAIVPPTLESLADPAVAGKVNGLILRNTSIGNQLDRTAITLPIHTADELPVGLMLMGKHGSDRRLLALAKGIEDALSMK